MCGRERDMERYVKILPLHELASNVTVFGCVVENVCACVGVNACGFEYVCR